MATYEELTEEVIAHQFSPTQYTTYVQNRLNQGLRYICAQTDFEEINTFYSVSLPGPTSYFTLPTDFNRIQYLELQDGDRWKPLTQLPVARFDRLVAATGNPMYYALRPDNAVTVNPVSDSEVVVGLAYYRDPDPLVNPNDVPVIPEQYHYMLVHYALKFCYERENDYTSAQYHWGQFQEAIMKCRGEVHNAWNTTSQPRRIGDDATDLTDLIQGV
jgi:hypothetical protein